MIERTRNILVPCVLGMTAFLVCLLSGCGKGEKSVEKAQPQGMEYMKDPAFQQAIKKEAAVRQELLKTRVALEGKLADAQAAGDAREVASLSNRIAEVKVAIDDVRRRMLVEVQRQMTNALPRTISK